MHHLSGEGDFDRILGPDSWPIGHATLPARQAFVVGLLPAAGRGRQAALGAVLGLAAACHGGPDALQRRLLRGAVGATSRAFLLLRVGPIFDGSAGARGGRRWPLGLVTAVFAYLAGSVETDIKGGRGLCVADAGGDHRGRDRAGVPLCRTGPPAGPRLPAHAPVPACPDAAGRLSHAGERDRGSPAAGPPALGAAGDRSRRGLAVPARARAGPSRPLLLEYVVRPFVGASRGAGGWNSDGRTACRGRASRESDQVKLHFGTIWRVVMNIRQLPWLDDSSLVSLFGSSWWAGSGSRSAPTLWGLAFTGAAWPAPPWPGWGSTCASRWTRVCT